MDSKELVRRLKAFLGVSKDRELWEYLEIDKSTLSRWKSGSNTPDFLLILAKFPSISLDWLTQETSVNTINLQAFQNICRQGGKPPIVLVPEKARAGYRNSFSQAVDYELPIIQIQGYTDGNRYRFFEISGDSMMPTLETGDYVLCELVASLQDIKQHGIYVLHTHNDILCKHIEIQGTRILLHSDNLAYLVQEIHENDIKNYWRVISFFRNLP